MTKLRDHFGAMQGMAEAYLTPGTYTDRNGIAVDKQSTREAAFTGDMIYMLDGPEQREACKEEDQQLLELQLKLGDAQSALKELADQLAIAHSDRGRATEKLGLVKHECNDLRSRLYTSELAYAKLRGYLDRVVDERPPELVPQHREPMHAQMPDGSMGTDHGGWRGGDSARDRKWFHR
jgi:hypothetical protein